MKSFKLAQFECRSALMSMGIYYGIYITVMIFLTIINRMNGGEMSFSSLEFSSCIFLLVSGIVTAKGTFKFTQANNLTRKTYFFGTLLAVPAVAVVMACIDAVLYRLFALFMTSMSAFDMIYHNDLIFGSGNASTPIWHPINTFASISSAFFWQLTLYACVFMLGMLFGSVLYRSNRVIKIVLAIAPVLLIMFVFNTSSFLPGTFWSSVGNFLAAAFGLNNGNSYMAALSFTVLFSVFSGIAWLFIRRMTIKK